jgi:hypothetical protein
MATTRALVEYAALSDDDLNRMIFDNTVNYVKQGYVSSEAFRANECTKLLGLPTASKLSLIWKWTKRWFLIKQHG